MVLSKNDNNYVFEVNTKIDGLELITYDGDYCYKDNIIYHSPKKVLDLIDDMKEKRMNKLMFEEKDLNSFVEKKLWHHHHYDEVLRIDFSTKKNAYWCHENLMDFQTNKALQCHS